MPTSRRSRSSRSRVSKVRPWMLISAIALALLAVPLAILINHVWPYRYKNVKPMLQNVFASQITIASYHRTYFPRPGFVAENVTLRRISKDGALPALGHTQEIRVEGGWLDLLLLRRRVELVDVRGMTVSLPPANSEELREDFPPGSSADFGGPDTTIATLRAQDSMFEIQRVDEDPLRFPIKLLVLKDVVKNKAVNYSVDMKNAMPAGHIVAHGQFGPLVQKNLAETPLSGDFKYDEVDLGKATSALHGVLSSEGHFNGKLGAISARATEDTPDFAVGDGRPIDLAVKVQCLVNALSGDVAMKDVDATMGKTEIHLTGAITGSPKRTLVNAVVTRGRAEDLLRPFMRDKPPIRGSVALHLHAEIRPGAQGESFLKRLHADGSFDAAQEMLTNKTEEAKLSQLSAREQGDTHADEHPDDNVLSSISGPVTIRDGVATSPRLEFTATGIDAVVHGTFSFTDKSLHMTGQVTTESDLSHVATGWKAALLKPVSPLFKHKDKGTVIPVAITGTQGEYNISQDVLHNK